MDEDKITLEFENGSIVECEVLGVFDVKGVEYIALESADSWDTEIFLYRYVPAKEEGRFEMLDIPENDFEMVKKEFNAILEREL